MEAEKKNWGKMLKKKKKKKLYKERKTAMLQIHFIKYNVN